MAIVLCGYSQSKGTYPKSVFVNGTISTGVELTADKPYYKNGDTRSSRSGTSSNYNAYYNKNTGVLELRGYSGDKITAMQDYVRYEPYEFKMIKVNVTGNSTITTTEDTGLDFIVKHQTTLRADSAVVNLCNGASLNINVTYSMNLLYVNGIYAEKSLLVTTQGTGQGKLNINVKATNSSSSPQVYGINCGNFYCRGNADLNITTHGQNNSIVGGGCGLFPRDYSEINMNGSVVIDASDATIFSYGIFNNFVNERTPIKIVRFKTINIKAKRAGSYGGVTSYNKDYIHVNHFACDFNKTDNGVTNGVFEITYTMKPTVIAYDVTVVEPKVGAHPSTSFTNNGTGYKVTKVSWWKNYTQIMYPESYICEEGEQFDVHIICEPNEGYGQLNEDFLKFYINGHEARFTRYDTYCIGYYTFDLGMKGDVNSDKKVNIGDVVAVINHIAGKEEYAKADVNKDGKVNIGDVVAVINIIAGK